MPDSVTPYTKEPTPAATSFGGSCVQSEECSIAEGEQPSADYFVIDAPNPNRTIPMTVSTITIMTTPSAASAS